jgi:hypothetical protein
MKSILKKLQEDKHYYGAYGRQFLSNSNISILLNNPSEFGKQGVETLPMLHGRYFHVSMLEPEKLDQFDVVDCSSRNTKAYKEASAGRLILLRKEQHQLDLAIEKMKNSKFGNEIYSEGAEYEVPMIDDFFGAQFKGKADIITKDKIIDIKTSGSIDKFRQKASLFNYDSQAYIYSTMFSLPFEFFVISKETLQLKRIKCSSDFLERGRDKVERAVAVWKKFFGPNRTDDVNDFIATEVL